MAGEIFQKCDGIDYIARGEGEHTMLELCVCLKRGKPPDREIEEDIDSLPFPANQLVPPKAYLPSSTFHHRFPHASIIGARGFPGVSL